MPDQPVGQSEAWRLRELHLLMDQDDYNLFRKWAINRQYADSAYAFRRLLEQAGLRRGEATNREAQAPLPASVSASGQPIPGGQCER